MEESTLKLKQRGEESLDNLESKARAQIVPGVTLYGYCCGIFGRDSYREKVVLSVHGNSLVCKYEDGTYTSGNVYSWVDLVTSSNDWLESENER